MALGLAIAGGLGLASTIYSAHQAKKSALAQAEAGQAAMDAERRRIAGEANTAASRSARRKRRLRQGLYATATGEDSLIARFGGQNPTAQAASRQGSILGDYGGGALLS